MVNDFMFNNLDGRNTKRWDVDPGYSMKVYSYNFTHPRLQSRVRFEYVPLNKGRAKL
jgi:hypothetical protein